MNAMLGVETLGQALRSRVWVQWFPTRSGFGMQCEILFSQGGRPYTGPAGRLSAVRGSPGRELSAGGTDSVVTISHMGRSGCFWMQIYVSDIDSFAWEHFPSFIPSVSGRLIGYSEQ